MAACENEYTETALYLLQKGANPKLADHEENTALHVACEKGMVEVVVAMKHGSDLTKKNKNGETALDLARQHNMEEIVKILEK